MADVVIVGGGLGGLVAARVLASGGLDVTIVEASDRLGGTVARHTVGGLDLDAGAESFATRGGTVAALATDLGLADALVTPNPTGAWLQRSNGKAAPIPLNTLLGIPGSPLASDVVAIIGWPAAFRAFFEAMLPGTVAANESTLAELVRRRMGDTVVRELVNPIVRGVHSGRPGDVEVDVVAPGLRAAMRRTGSLARAVLELRGGGSPALAGGTEATRAGSAVAGLRGGVNRLVEELVVDLERFGVRIVLGERVERFDATGVTVSSGRIEGRVVIAAPGLDGSGATARHATLVTLVVDEPRLDAAPRGTGVLVADGAPGIRARGLTHATVKWAWLAERAAGKHVLRLSYEEPIEQAIETAIADASELLGVPIAASSVIDSATVEWARWPRTAPESGDVHFVGETAAGTGIAAIVAHSTAVAGKLLQDIRTQV